MLDTFAGTTFPPDEIYSVEGNCSFARSTAIVDCAGVVGRFENHIRALSRDPEQLQIG